MGLFDRLRRKPGIPEIDDLEALKASLELLPTRFPTPATAVGPGAEQAKEQIPIVCRNIDDAVAALRDRRDPQGNEITPAQVGNGLQRLADTASRPAFTGLMIMVLSNDGIGEFERSMANLAAIAARLRAG